MLTTKTPVSSSRLSPIWYPFASHPARTFAWQKFFSGQFEHVGEYIRKHRFRISMHPDQFVLLNAPDGGVLRCSIAYLVYQVKVLDFIGLTIRLKSRASIDRFVKCFELLEPSIRNRPVIENNEGLYTVRDCPAINKQSGIPVTMDSFPPPSKIQGENCRSAPASP